MFEMEIFKLFIIIFTLNTVLGSSLKRKLQRSFGISPVEAASYRLPNNTRPVFYDLHIKTFLISQISDFTGKLKLEFVAEQTTKSVTLHAKDLKIQAINLLDVDSNVIQRKINFEFDTPKDFLKIKLGRLMQKDEHLVLEIFFSGVLNKNGVGLYRSYFYNEGDPNKQNYYVASQFQPTYARTAFPCYDEPRIRAQFAVEIEHSKTNKAFSNTEIISERKGNQTDYIITSFRTTPALSTYSVVIVVGPFTVISNNDPRTTQTIIGAPSKMKGDKTYFAFSKIGPVLTMIEDNIGVKFSFTKLDHLTVDNFEYEGIENYGLLIYRESTLLTNSTQSEVEQARMKKRLPQVLARLNANQFFGSVISPNWWSDLWLKEGFATFYEYYIADLLYPDDNYMNLFLEEHMMPVMEYDILKNTSSKPISVYIEKPEDILLNFKDEMIKSRAGAIIRMLQASLGYDTFQKGLQWYIQRRIYQSASPDDLFSSFQDAVNEDQPGLKLDIEKIMKSWVYQAGYPIVSVSTFWKNLTLRQHRYPTTKGEIYSIPLTYATRKIPTFNVNSAWIWFDKENMTIPLDDLLITDKDWIIFNIQHTGLYRMSYTPELWRLIARKLRNDPYGVHPINRELLLEELQIGFEILEDVFFDNVLDVMSYLVYEDLYEAWVMADIILESVQFHFVGTEAYENFLLYLRYITKNQLERLGLDDKEHENDNEKVLREILIDYSCYGLAPICVNRQIELLKLLLQGKDVSVHFCAVFNNIPTPAFMHFLKIIEEDLSFPDRVGLITGLTCSVERDQLQLLMAAFENENNVISDEEKVIAISKMLYASNLGQTEAIGYLSRYPAMISDEEVQYVLKNAINSRKYEEIVKKILKTAFYAHHLTIDEVLEIQSAISTRTLWHEFNYNAAVEWFKNNIKLITKP